MKKQSVLIKHRERLLQLTVLCVVIAYIPFNSFVSAEPPVPTDVALQRYFTPTSGRQPSAGEISVFAPNKNADIWQDLAVKVWLQTKVGLVAARSAELETPPLTATTPPMLLPTPGPALNATHDLPRWPEFIQSQDNP